MNNIEKLKKHFYRKTQEIIAIADQVIASHPGIFGDHREKIIDIFLKSILPAKYSVETGILVGVEHQKDYESQQSDIIIWDSFNYPKIKQLRSSLIFAESAKMMIEIKTNFKELDDIKKKTKRIKEFFPPFHPSLKEEIWRLDNKIARVAKRKAEAIMIESAPQIAVSAICYKGGNKFTIENVGDRNKIEDNFPDLMLLIEAGKVIYKQYVPDNKIGKGFLTVYETKENSLLGFTGLLMSLLAARDTVTTSPFQLVNHIEDILLSCEKEMIEFPISRPLPGIEIVN